MGRMGLWRKGLKEEFDAMEKAKKHDEGVEGSSQTSVHPRLESASRH